MEHENQLLDNPNQPVLKSRLYYIGTSLSIGALLFFVLMGMYLVSVGICLLGTIIVYVAPAPAKEKRYAFVPLAALLGLGIIFYLLTM